jgi:hypothetical protein
MDDMAGVVRGGGDRGDMQQLYDKSVTEIELKE